MTAAKLADPKQVYSSIRKSVNDAADFERYRLKGVSLSSDVISSRQVHIAVPEGTSFDQWVQIRKGIDYGLERNVQVVVVPVKR